MIYDLIVIGSGPGGYVSAIRAAQLGMKVAIVEKEKLGGICLNWGCIPTKALLKSAQVFNYLNHAEDYGLSASNVFYDFDKIINRSRNVADKMNKGIEFLMRKNKIDVITGIAKLQVGKKISVLNPNADKTEYTANHIIIATGARSRSLPSIPQDGVRIIGYREAMTLKNIPKSILVVGSGAIGVEFAYFYATLGVNVTIVEYQSNIVPVEDLDIAIQLEKSLKKIGVKILTSTSVEKVIQVNDTMVATLKSNISQDEEILEAEIVLSAVGITPNTENIGIEDVGITTNKGKIVVNDYYQTNVAGYYAIGDIIPTQALAHVASAEGITCVEKIAGLVVDTIDYKNIPGCTYCSPEIASVGLTEKQAIAAGYELKIGKFPFSASGKATANGDNEGFVKVIFDAKYGEWLGCHMIGNGVTEMIAEAVVARKLETTGHEILKSIHPHPTLSEALMEAVAAAYGEVIHI